MTFSNDIPCDFLPIAYSLLDLISVQHLYNGLKLGKDEIESIAIWEQGEGGWDGALQKAESWLVY